MAIFSKKVFGGGLMDVIRCDETDYLIWKWHPQGTEAGNNRKENAIRFGSSLRVKDGEVAVFVYKQDDGTMQDCIEGPYDGILETKNLPVISNIIGLAYAGESPFQAEVYFINLANIVQTKFAVPFFDVFDPRFLDYSVPVAVRGTINFKIDDYSKFARLNKLSNFSMEDFKNQIKDTVIRIVKGVVANAPQENSIPVVQLERKIDEINSIAESKIKTRFEENYAVSVTSIDISAIDIDKSSAGYRQLSEVTKDLSTAKLKAQNEAEISDIKDNQKLGIFEKAGRIFTDIKEDAYARHKQTQTANFAAYQTEAQEHVGVAGAEGLGKMGANGSGNMGSGINPASMMAGMAVGGAIGQNIAGNINNMMGGMNQQNVQQTPPPINGLMYNVAVNGQPTGPFDLASLSKMIMAGELLEESLVWTKGMSEWKKAADVENIKELFNKIPPIPNDEMPPIPQ